MENEGGVSVYSYWGKAGVLDSQECADYHLLPYHALDVAAVGAVLLQEQPRLKNYLATLSGVSAESFQRWMIFFLALHDLGKFCDSFQQLRPDVQRHLQEREGSGLAMRHDSLGFLLWQKVIAKPLKARWQLKPKSRYNRGDDAIDLWMRAMAGHHGLPPIDPNGLLKDYARKEDEQAAFAFVDQVETFA